MEVRSRMKKLFMENNILISKTHFIDEMNMFIRKQMY